MNDDGHTLTQLRSDAYSPDRNVRKSSYEREKKILHENRTALAAALNGIKGTCLTIERRQGWSDPLEHSLFISRLSRKAFDALLEALERGLPVFRRYFRAKAALLGLDVLEWYDLDLMCLSGMIFLLRLRQGMNTGNIHLPMQGRS